MNYGVTAIGATLVIFHFLRLCGVMGYHDQESVYQRLHQEYFQLGPAKMDDTVKGWFTRDPLLKEINIVKSIWTDGSLSSFSHASLQTIFARSPRRFSQPSELDSIRGSVKDPLCNLQESQNTNRSESGETIPFSEIIPHGCRSTDANKTLICDHVTTVPTLLPKLDLFVLNGTEIQRLGPSAFGQTKVKTMKIHGNKIHCLHPQAFHGVTGLKVLSIGDNNLEYVRPEFFSSLNETVYLYLEHNKINLVNYPAYGWDDKSDENITVLPGLFWLSLMGNPLGVIPKYYFHSLRNSPLKLLKLTNCKLTFIEPGALESLRQLDTLDLSENPGLMTSLLQAFQDFHPNALKQLNLASNNLDEVPHEALALISSSLEILDLSLNMFDTLTPFCLPPELSNLKSLNLDNSRIRTIDPAAFRYLQKLETLFLTNNRLATVPPAVSNLRNLIEFDLSGNQPAQTVSIGLYQTEFEIPEGVFRNMTKLKRLSMNKLPLRTINENAFEGADSLLSLSIGEAKVEHVANFSFSNLMNLTTLNLNGNAISKLFDITFYGLKKLQNLYLEFNEVEFPCAAPQFPRPEWKGFTVAPYEGSITFGSSNLPNTSSVTEPFRYMPKLTRLHMSYNKIRYLNQALFKHSPSLQTVDLSSNYIHSWTSELILNGSVISNFSVAHNNIGPVSPAMIHDLKIVQDHSGRAEWSVDLSDNPLVCDEKVCDILKMVENGTLRLKRWDQRASHSCMDPLSRNYYRLMDSVDKVCTPGGDAENVVTATTLALGNLVTTVSPGNKAEKHGPSVVASVVIVLTCILSIAGALAVGYKKRFHLKYFCFVVRFNVVNLPNLSAAEKKRIYASNYDYDIFLSYNHMDRDFIQDYLVPNLEGENVLENNNNVDVERAGLRICIHERDFQVGVPITENIVDFVDKSRKVVVVVSRNYLQSQWCLYEMNLAYHRLIESGRKSFVVILLEDIPSSLRTKSLNYLLVSRTYLEWPGNEAPFMERHTFWKRLSQSLKNLDSH